jgi:hypothetical protein
MRSRRVSPGKAWRFARSAGARKRGVIYGSGCPTFAWDPAISVLPRETLAGVDTVYHLIGEPVGGRWTKAKKASIGHCASPSRNAGASARAVLIVSNGALSVCLSIIFSQFRYPAPPSRGHPFADHALEGMAAGWFRLVLRLYLGRHGVVYDEKTSAASSHLHSIHTARLGGCRAFRRQRREQGDDHMLWHGLRARWLSQEAAASVQARLWLHRGRWRADRPLSISRMPSP